MASSLKWNRKFFDHVDEESARRLNKVAAALQSDIIDNISASTRAHGPSLPHQFPHADTGRLRQSVTIRPATARILTASVGSSLDYARYLELGTKKMKPRPFLRKTFNKSKARLRRVFKQG